MQGRRPHQQQRLPRGLALALILGLVGACQSDGLHPTPPLDRDKLYWSLELNHQAVTLSTAASGYDTLRLVATPRTVDGLALSPTVAPIFASSDPERLVIREGGLLQALHPGVQPVTVTVTVTVGDVKRQDQVQVMIVDEPEPPVLTRFSIHPTPPDSAKTAARSLFAYSETCFQLPTWTETPINCKVVIPVQVLDAAGTPIPGVPVSIRSADSTQVQITDGLISPGSNAIAPSTVLLYASTTVFGVRRTDTLPLQLGWPVTVVVTVQSAAEPIVPSEVHVGTGGVVFWHWDGEAPIDIAFDDPTHVAAVDPTQQPYFFFSPITIYCSLFCGGAGNFILDQASSPLPNTDYAVRAFPVPGVYSYHSTALGGLHGRIVVMDESVP